MHRQKAILNQFAVAIGLALALPACALAAPGSAAQVSATQAALSDLAVSASLLDAWRDYAFASLRPDFSWASDGDEPIRAPSLFERGRARLLPPASHFNGSVIDSNPFHVVVSSTRVSDTAVNLPAGANSLLANHAAGLQRYVVAPSISQRLGSVGSVNVSAIFAYQHFAEVGLTPAVPYPAGDFASIAPPALRTSDTSSGAGLRVDYTNQLTNTVDWQLGVQSRINMDALNNYKGMYAEPGTFDIPASANVGLGFALTPGIRLDAGVERVMYSQVTPFTSSALPPRFLALLSSSISPTFAWQDLDVYSIGASVRDGTNGDWTLRYSTREQPVPTSVLLQNALPNASARNYELGYAHGFGDRSSFRLSASYAPTDFILGVPLSYSVSHAGNQMQWEALWITSF
jgi:hypothetical protein